MSVRRQSTADARAAAANRMRALLTHDGPMIHVDHTHRAVAATGMAWVRALDNTEQRVYEKGDRVEVTRGDGNTYEATVVGVSPPAEGTNGLPSGYTVQIDGRDDVIDTIAEKLLPLSPNAYTAVGDGKKYKLCGRA